MCIRDSCTPSELGIGDIIVAIAGVKKMLCPTHRAVNDFKVTSFTPTVANSVQKGLGYLKALDIPQGRNTFAVMLTPIAFDGLLPKNALVTVDFESDCVTDELVKLSPQTLDGRFVSGDELVVNDRGSEINAYGCDVAGLLERIAFVGDNEKVSQTRFWENRKPQIFGQPTELVHHRCAGQLVSMLLPKPTVNEAVWVISARQV